MSKNFEQAYKELAQIEAPDLWDRIGAGLTSKSTSETSDINIDRGKDADVIGNVDISVDTKMSEDLDGNIDASINVNEEKKVLNKIRLFTRKYAGIAAAILCVAIILPAVALMKRTGDKSFSGASMEGIDMAQAIEESAADTAMPEEAGQMEEAAEPETAGAGAVADDMSADGGADNKTAKNTQASMTNARSEAATTEEADMSDDEGSTDMDGGDLSSKKSNVEKQQASESEEAKKIEDMDSAISGESVLLPEGTILEGIIVEVRSVSEGTDRDSGEGTPGSVYTVVIKEDASGKLFKDSELEVFVPAYASFVLPVGETYVIDIAYTGEGKYPVVRRGEKVEK